MILQNIKFSLRNFRNRKLFTIVNISGLTIGIVAASLILIYVSYELSFDRFHKNSRRIFRVYSTYTMGGLEGSWVKSPIPLGPFLQNKFPEIEKTVRITRLSKGLVSSSDKSFFEDRIVLADSSVFDIFTFPMVIGNAKTVLAQPNAVVLSESAAEKYFGKSDPVGRTVRYNRTIDLTVTGIMKDIPGNTHLQFDMIVPMSAAKTFLGKDYMKDRMSTVTNLYLMTNQSVKADRLEKYVSQSTMEYNDGIDLGGNKQQYHVQELTSIHLHSNMGGEFAPNSNIKSIYILSTIAFLILTIACINYINLSFSINSRRTTELGMRRIMGARRAQLIMLYLSDASVLVGISIIIAAITISDQLPWFSSFVGSDLSKNYSVRSMLPAFIILFILITSITGLASGWISSRVSSMDTLKKQLSETKKRIGIQGLLVLFQFGISIILIASTLFVYRQMRFIQNLNLGFSKDQLMIIPVNDNTMSTRILSFKHELIRNPNILSAGVTSDLPGEMKWVASVDFEGSVKRTPMGYLAIDKDFFKTYGVHLKAGYMPGDTTCPYPGTQYLLNESAVKELGWGDPIGKKFSSYNGKDGFVTGVISDFHFKSLREKVEPLFLFERENDPKYIAIKLSANSISASVDFTKNLWNKMAPDSPFEYFFYDNYYDQIYKKERRFGKVIFIFSAIAILIACMGLFGLAAFFSEKRTKEIGIRKVNGATVAEVMIMLNTKFIKWVVIAFLIATPVALYAIHKWLQSFAYKTELNWWIFCLAGIIALGIAILTVSWQSWRAAIRNPVDALRHE